MWDPKIFLGVGHEIPCTFVGSFDTDVGSGPTTFSGWDPHFDNRCGRHLLSDWIILKREAGITYRSSRRGYVY